MITGKYLFLMNLLIDWFLISVFEYTPCFVATDVYFTSLPPLILILPVTWRALMESLITPNSRREFNLPAAIRRGLLLQSCPTCVLRSPESVGNSEIMHPYNQTCIKPDIY